MSDIEEEMAELASASDSDQDDVAEEVKLAFYGVKQSSYAVCLLPHQCTTEPSTSSSPNDLLVRKLGAIHTMTSTQLLNKRKVQSSSWRAVVL